MRVVRLAKLGARRVVKRGERDEDGREEKMLRGKLVEKKRSRRIPIPFTSPPLGDLLIFIYIIYI